MKEKYSIRLIFSFFDSYSSPGYDEGVCSKIIGEYFWPPPAVVRRIESEFSGLSKWPPSSSTLRGIPSAQQALRITGSHSLTSKNVPTICILDPKDDCITDLAKKRIIP